MSEEEADVEVIAFESSSSAQVFLPQVRWRGTAEDLRELIRQKFSPFGLVQHVFCDRSRGHAGQEDSDGFCNWYSAVDFYSKRSARRARAFLHGSLAVGGRTCKVLESSRDFRGDRPLPLGKCQELANFYLGFGGWNSEILHQGVDSEEVVDGKLVQTYCSVSRLTFACAADVRVDGVGTASASFSPGGGGGERCAEVATARKKAAGAALQDAFSRVLLVVVEGKAVGVEVDYSKGNDLHVEAAAALERCEAGEVAEVEYEVEEGEEDA